MVVVGAGTAVVSHTNQLSELDVLTALLTEQWYPK